MKDLPEPQESEIPQSRLELIWDVLMFQVKLAMDGFRDIVLSPVSVIAAIVGLIVGGSRPNQYYRRVLNFGRRTEDWINLFGYRNSSGTSDEIVKPLQERVFEEANNRPWIKKAGNRLNKSIDSVGNVIKPKDGEDGSGKS